MQYIKNVEEDGTQNPLLPSTSFKTCPIKICAGILGKKWTLVILRDIGMRKIQRFNRLIESIPGITPRVLSFRLKELEEEGSIECVERQGPKLVRWALTEKGEDTLPILMIFIAFGSKWYADDVFEDRKPRTMKQLYKTLESREIIEKYSTR